MKFTTLFKVSNMTKDELKSSYVENDGKSFALNFLRVIGTTYVVDGGKLFEGVFTRNLDFQWHDSNFRWHVLGRYYLFSESENSNL